jgi:hypothetical protein
VHRDAALPWLAVLPVPDSSVRMVNTGDRAKHSDAGPLEMLSMLPTHDTNASGAAKEEFSARPCVISSPLVSHSGAALQPAVIEDDRHAALAASTGDLRTVFRQLG